jgi:hypothetical protein
MQRADARGRSLDAPAEDAGRGARAAAALHGPRTPDGWISGAGGLTGAVTAAQASAETTARVPTTSHTGWIAPRPVAGQRMRSPGACPARK